MQFSVFTFPWRSAIVVYFLICRVVLFML